MYISRMSESQNNLNPWISESNLENFEDPLYPLYMEEPLRNTALMLNSLVPPDIRDPQNWYTHFNWESTITDKTKGIFALKE